MKTTLRRERSGGFPKISPVGKLAFFLCIRYHNRKLLTLSASCVKGAAIAFDRMMFMGFTFAAAPDSDAVIFIFEVQCMETRVAVMSIIVEDPDSVERLNAVLHEFGQWIIGRMGIPYRKRGVSIISVALDAPQNTISALAGKIGSLPGISVKTAYSAVVGQESEKR